MGYAVNSALAGPPWRIQSKLIRHGDILPPGESLRWSGREHHSVTVIVSYLTSSY